MRIPRFLEVYVDSPLEICIARDPKGIYRKAREGAGQTLCLAFSQCMSRLKGRSFSYMAIERRRKPLPGV